MVWHSVVLSCMAVYSYIQGMWNTAWQSVWCQCSCWSSILILFWVAFFFLLKKIPMWLLCSCCKSCFCNIQGIIICLYFITVPSIMVNSCLISKYFSAQVLLPLLSQAICQLFTSLAPSAHHLLLLLLYLLSVYIWEASKDVLIVCVCVCLYSCLVSLDLVLNVIILG